MGQFILAVILLLALAENADAQQTARHPDGDTATITDEPCADPGVLAKLPPPMHEQFRAGEATVSGVRYAFCWRDVGASVHMIYPDGDQGIIPWSEFEKPNKRGT